MQYDKSGDEHYNTISAFIKSIRGSDPDAALYYLAKMIAAGEADIVVAGGMESMTNAPYLLPQARAGQRLGHGKLIDGMIQDGLWDVYNDFHMGNTGELVAEKYEISRQEQDEYAAMSQQRACAAEAAGKFDAERFTVEVPGRKGAVTEFSKDEGPREGTTAESLGKLKPAFKRDGGTVTAGNASSINDGAAALVAMALLALLFFFLVDNAEFFRRHET